MTYRPFCFSAAVCLAAFFFTGQFSASGQGTGGIRGLITDREFEVPLPDATVRILEKDVQAETDDSGHFVLSDLEAGAYTVVVSKRGYQRGRKSDVVVTAGSMRSITIALAGEYVELQELVVRPLRLGGSTELGLLNLRAEDLGIMDAIGADLMSKAGAGSAAEAITLVSGASLREGKYAVIRGLSDRFVNTQMNGIPMPTADPEVRAVQLDLFPSALLESVRVHKTFTPDLPGNTSGGRVNIVTPRMPAGRIFELKLGVSYNTQATGNDAYLTSDDGGVTYFGMDVGPRGKPLESGSVAEPNLSKSYHRSPPPPEQEALFRELDRQTRLFSSTIGTTRDTAPLAHSWSVTYGDRRDVEGDLTLGWLATGTYKNSYSYYDDGVDQFKVPAPNFDGFEIPRESSETQVDPDQWQVEQGEETVRWGLGTLFGMELGEHSLSLSYIRTQHVEDTSTILWDEDSRAMLGETPLLYWHNQSLIYTERTLSSLQLRGKHPLPVVPDDGGFSWGALTLKKPTLDWSFAVNEATQNQPDRRFFLASFTPYDRSGNALNKWGDPRKPESGWAERSWREITEKNDYSEVNVTWPFELAGKEGELKAGLSATDTDRDYEQDSFYYLSPQYAIQYVQRPWGNVPVTVASPYNNYYSDGFADLWTDVFLAPGHVGYAPPYGQGTDYSEPTPNEVNWVIQDFSEDIDYHADMQVEGKYFMGKVPVFSWLDLIGGARWEYTKLQTEIHAADGNDENVKIFTSAVEPDRPSIRTPKDLNTTLDAIANADIDQLDILPSVGFVIEPTDRLQLRGTWSRSIGRPTFREITPTLQQDHVGGQQFGGNPSLQIAKLKNYDLRLEWRPAPGQLLSFGGFYKEVKDPIDYAQRESATSNPFIVPFNFDEGEILGAEVELRQNVGQWAGFLDSVSQSPRFGWLSGIPFADWQGWLSNLSVGANFTVLDASVTVQEFDVIKITRFIERADKDPSDYNVDERRMKDQPEYIINLFLLYESEETGTSAGVFWNRKGETLVAGESASGSFYIANLVEKPYDSLNVSFSQEFWDHWKLSLKAENLLNPEIQEVWQSDYVETESVAKSYTKGITFSLSLSATW